MIDSRLTNKRLVKRLMDTKGITMISITDSLVLVQCAKDFTPLKARELIHDLGHDFDARTRRGPKEEKLIVFPRF